MAGDAMDISPSAVDVALSSAAVATLTSTVASTVGTVVAAATIRAAESPLQDEASAMDTQCDDMKAQVLADSSQLENPPTESHTVDNMMKLARRATLGLTAENVSAFCESCEFISLGCCCAVSSALELLGLKRNSYPFDWVRSSLEGITHCLDVQFEDFLTYSTYSVTDQYVVFGGTRWGGSFWHHNLEVPMTRKDMSRRVSRFYGRENISMNMPRVFVRVINSSREIHAAIRFRKTLCSSLLGEPHVYMLFIVDMQTFEGAMSIQGQDGHGLLFYAIRESETTHNITQGAEAFRLCSETYTRAIAFAITHWAAGGSSENVQMFANLNQLCAACVQFDGGDTGRELFTPRKFYGQQMETFSEKCRLQNLFAKIQTQMFMLPQDIAIDVPYPVECFGRSMRVKLPAGSLGGDVLQLYLNDCTLSASVGRMAQGQLTPVGVALVEELYEQNS